MRLFASFCSPCSVRSWPSLRPELRPLYCIWFILLLIFFLESHLNMMLFLVAIQRLTCFVYFLLKHYHLPAHLNDMANTHGVDSLLIQRGDLLEHSHIRV